MTKSQILLSLLLFSFFGIQCSNNLNSFEIDNPAMADGKYSRLYTDNTGAVFMSWMSTSGDSTTLLYSKYDEEKWTRPSVISASDSWFVNWADFPSIIGRNGKPMAAHWLQKKEGGTYSYDIAVSQFKNNQFAPYQILHGDNTATEHGFVSMIPLSDTSFYAIWLDGRNMKEGHIEESNTTSGNFDDAMNLRGALLSPNTPIEEKLIDNTVCECCNTTIARSGNKLFAAYRNRTVDEIRDIYVTSLDLTTGEWEESENVSNDGWNIAGCPVNGPQIGVNNNLVALAWFTGANDIPRVKLRTSIDGGENWQETTVIEEGTALGRVDMEITSDDEIWVTWVSRFEDAAQLKLAVYDKNGTQISNQVVAELSASRSAGFPQLELFDDKKMVSWTDISGDQPRIRTAIIQ